MQVKFKDFYHQYIDINDETASGNVRIRVRTMKDLCKTVMTKEDDCEIETDISLTQEQVHFLISTLSMMLRDEE